jgi:hypothetical protein
MVAEAKQQYRGISAFIAVNQFRFRPLQQAKNAVSKNRRRAVVMSLPCARLRYALLRCAAECVTAKAFTPP